MTLCSSAAVRVASGLLLSLLLAVPPTPTAQAQQPRALFDSHLHYNRDMAARFEPAEIVSLLRRQGVKRALVTGYPPANVLALHALAPDLVLPLLGVYRSETDKQVWTQDTSLPLRVMKQLDQGPWRGIGELHLFARQRRSAVFLQLAALAAQRDMPMLLHCDPAVIDSLYEHQPQLRVIWAHAGTYPYPALLRDYLSRYPRLSVDLSVRDARIAPGGKLDPAWEKLLWEYPERFLVGVDTFSVTRWSDYAAVTAGIRGWLAQLPQDIAGMIAHDNAERLFGTGD